MAIIANEKGTLVFTITSIDSTGLAIAPTSASWQLMKRDGTIINSRTFANGSFSGNTVVISGDDLALDSSGDVNRIFAVQITYDNDIDTGLFAKEEVEFLIRNLYSQS